MRVYSRLVLTLWCLCSFALAGQAAAQESEGQPGTLTGTVYDEASGLPVHRAAVQLLSDERIVATATADRVGRFRFEIFRPGIYRARAQRAGYRQADSRPVQVAGGGVGTVAVVLSHAAVTLDSLLTWTLPAPAALAPDVELGEQLLQGDLVDADSGYTLAGGFIGLRDGDGKWVDTTVSDAEGYFRLKTPRPGTYTLEGRFENYKSAVQTGLRFGVGDTLLVAFNLSPQTTVAEPLTFIASNESWLSANSWRATDEMADRRKQYRNNTHAHFLTRDAIQHMSDAGYETEDVLWSFIEADSFGSRSCWGIASYVDGQPTRLSGLVGLGEETTPLGELVGVEAYNYPSIPNSFRPARSRAVTSSRVPDERESRRPPCAVVGLWTTSANVGHVQLRSFAPPRIGLIAGFSSANLTDLPDGFSRRNGFSGGATFSAPISPFASAQFDLIYTMKGVLAEPRDQARTIKLDYVELPVLIRFDLPIAWGRFRPIAYGGASFAAATRCRVAGKDVNPSNGATCHAFAKAYNTPGVVTYPTLRFSPFDIGAVVGGGLAMRVGRRVVTVSARYDAGLMQVESDFTRNNRVLSIVTSFEMPIRR